VRIADAVAGILGAPLAEEETTGTLLHRCPFDCSASSSGGQFGFRNEAHFFSVRSIDRWLAFVT